MKTLLRREFKHLIRSQAFRSYFPEYLETFQDIDSKKIKVGCCGFPEQLYETCIKWVLADTQKWKNFLNTDRIQLYCGEPKRSHII